MVMVVAAAAAAAVVVVVAVAAVAAVVAVVAAAALWVQDFRRRNLLHRHNCNHLEPCTHQLIVRLQHRVGVQPTPAGTVGRRKPPDALRRAGCSPLILL